MAFLTEALNEIIRCRQILKWTYVYGYYLPKTTCKLEKDLFDMNQTDLEKYCDNLHGLIESPLDKFLDPNILDRSPFFHFKGQAIGLFEALKKYYKSITEHLKEQQSKQQVAF